MDLDLDNGRTEVILLSPTGQRQTPTLHYRPRGGDTLSPPMNEYNGQGDPIPVPRPEGLSWEVEVWELSYARDQFPEEAFAPPLLTT